MTVGRLIDFVVSLSKLKLVVAVDQLASTIVGVKDASLHVLEN